jgi:oligoribonuclease NrnB/cAMP/cGMP phosphodiesterase (DHH superfamily)
VKNITTIPTRIITRPDFDGIVCAVLLRAAFKSILPILWVEPNDIARGKIEVKDGDIIANLPYDTACSIWFDHHKTNNIESEFCGSYKVAPSAASVIMEYFSNELSHFSELVFFTDKIDSATFTSEEILSPEKYPYIILSMTVNGDSENDFEYFNWLVEKLGKCDILEMFKTDIVKKRIATFIEQNNALKKFLLENTVVRGGVVLIDTRGKPDMPRGNKFLMYSLFPDAYVSVRVRRDMRNENGDVISVGHSIVNRTCNVDAGNLVAAYGGGGHKGAGSCSISVDKTDRILSEIMETLLSNNES